MRRSTTKVTTTLTLVLVLLVGSLGVATAQEPPEVEGAPGTCQFPPCWGASGIGDPYFPKDGNGGYDVSHYGLELAYDPTTDVLDGVPSGRDPVERGELGGVWTDVSIHSA